MAIDRLSWVRTVALAKREIRTSGTWALTALFLGFGLLNTWPGNPDGTTAAGIQAMDLGILSFSSWVGFLLAIMSTMLPLWVIERVALDQSSRWFDPLFVAGWKRETYLVSQFAVVTGFGTAIFLVAVFCGAIASMMTGTSMPPDTWAKILVAIPTFLATAAAGLLLATVLRERVVALSVGVIGIAIPMAVSAFFILRLDQYPPDTLRLLVSLHLPPLGHDPAASWVLYKLAYACVALWLSVFLGERIVGRHS